MKSSPSIITLMKQRKMRWARHVARMARTDTHVEFWWEGQKKRNTYKDSDVEGN